MKPTDKTILPTLVSQNPSLVEKESQGYRQRVRQLADGIMKVFFQLLPSNYVSQVTGPFYTMQLQAAAEQLAKLQIAAQEVWADGIHDSVRPEFLYQILGQLVFPNDYPKIDGDQAYRHFLQQMVNLLLDGATKSTVEGGLNATGADGVIFEVVEKAVAARKTPNSAWNEDDQFSFEINVSYKDGTAFPPDPYTLSENTRIVMRVLKPAHTLYSYRHLFKEIWGQLFTDTPSSHIDSYYYEDFRRYHQGMKEIAGSQGRTLNNRRLFQDSSRSFAKVQPGAVLNIVTGPNEAQYRVVEVLSLFDDGARPYTTTGGLSGTATAVSGRLYDPDQTWVEGDLLSFQEGLNTGVYRLRSESGHVVPSTLLLDKRMPQVVAGQEYRVEVDRLGTQMPRDAAEDASAYFYI